MAYPDVGTEGHLYAVLVVGYGYGVAYALGLVAYGDGGVYPAQYERLRRTLAVHLLTLGQYAHARTLRVVVLGGEHVLHLGLVAVLADDVQYALYHLIVVVAAYRLAHVVVLGHCPQQCLHVETLHLVFREIQ